jgi:spore germination protein YaaH
MNFGIPVFLAALLGACAVGCHRGPPSPVLEAALDGVAVPSLPEGVFPQCVPPATASPCARQSSSIGDGLFVAGWLPYWKKAEGAASLLPRIDLFTEVNPFAFGVDADGNLADALRLGGAPWPELRQAARRKGVRVVPTILWTDAAAMHRVLADPSLRDSHVRAIADLLQREDFPGVDIDYEGKDVADRDAFTAFLRALRTRLSADGRSLSCTVEARTADQPPPGFPPTRAMAWANDFTALDECCDIVRIMAYDEVFLTRGAQVFQQPGRVPFLPNASIQWVEQTIRYALRHVRRDRLVLGVATYGWEYDLEPIPGGFRYAMVQSLSHRDAQARMRRKGVVVARNAGGELSFVFPSWDRRRIATIADARSVADRIALAKSYGLKGISLFKIDGLADPGLFAAIRTSSAP